jgi:hypothetical protein
MQIVIFPDCEMFSHGRNGGRDPGVFANNRKVVDTPVSKEFIHPKWK